MMKEGKVEKTREIKVPLYEEKNGKKIPLVNEETGEEAFEFIEEKYFETEVFLQKVNIPKYNVTFTEDTAFKQEMRRVKMDEIKNIFDSKISNFLSNYPKFEIQTFETKRKEAEKVLSGETSTYLEGLLEKKNEVLIAN